MITDSVFQFIDVKFPSVLIGYAFAVNNSMDTTYVYKTINGGSTWNKISMIRDPNYINQSSFTDVLTGYAISGYGEVFKTVNGGVNWNLQTTLNNAPYTIDFPAVDTGYASGIETYKTVDGGLNWNVVNSTLPSMIYTIKFTSTSTGFVCGGNGINSGFVYKTINGGLNWTLSYSNVETFQSMCFPSSSIGYTAGTNGVLAKYDASSGIQQYQNDFSFTLFPNPSTGIFNIECKEKVESITIHDIIGKEIYKSESSLKTIDGSNFPQGAYFFTIKTEKGTATKKVFLEK